MMKSLSQLLDHEQSDPSFFSSRDGGLFEQFSLQFLGQPNNQLYGQLYGPLTSQLSFEFSNRLYRQIRGGVE